MRRTGVPFRWNVSSPRLPRRGTARSLATPPGFHEKLLRTAAAVLRLAGDSELVFVGRSLENVFDFLSGALAETSWRDRVHLVQLSLRSGSPGRIRRTIPGALENLWLYFDHLSLTPPRILDRGRPVAFVDLVFNGGTFESLLKVLRSWTGPRDWAPLVRSLVWVCVVERDHPDYWPWEPGFSGWTELFFREQIRRVPIDWKLWRYLGEEQEKTTDAYTPARWDPGSREARDEGRLPAARMARALFRLGCWWRRRLAAELEGPTIPGPSLRALIGELRA